MTMSRGMTIADFVQQVYYAIYKVRLDVSFGTDSAFHADTDKFQEVVMEGNFVLQELQKEQDWNWLRDRWEMGPAYNPPGGIAEYRLPEDVYKPSTGFNDAVRLRRSPMAFIEAPWTSPRSGNTHNVAMHDEYGRRDVLDTRIHAFMVGEDITFTRPFLHGELGLMVETDVIRRMEPLHICTDASSQPCPHAYEDKVFTEIPDPYYMVVRTAAKRAEGDPSASDRVQSLTDEASKLLSAMRENDSAHTVPDTYTTSTIGFVPVY